MMKDVTFPNPNQSFGVQFGEVVEKTIAPEIGENGNWYINGEDTGKPSRGEDGKDGKDGYTPVKGVDYFDGKDGYTPVKGVDYFDGANGAAGRDGKDGYTPQKNIDYFDGKDGRDGVDGKDGADGKDGRTPVKGEDYFTEEDKAELVEELSEQMPSGGVTSWNDLTDKPFGETTTEGVILAEMVPDFTGQGAVPIMKKISITAGKEYTVHFGDNDYKCIAMEFEFTPLDTVTVALGNPNQLSGKPDYENYPFFIIALPEERVDELGMYGFVFTSNIKTTTTFSITAEVETIKPLDEKYLPDSVAKTTEVETMISEAILGAIGGAY